MAHDAGVMRSYGKKSLWLRRSREIWYAIMDM